MPDTVLVACSVVLVLYYVVVTVSTLYDVGKTIRVGPGQVLVYAIAAMLTGALIGRAWGWW